MIHTFQIEPQKAQSSDPGERSSEFVAVQGGADTTSAEVLLVSAYLAMWAIVLGFLLLSWRRQGRVESRLIVLEQALSKAENKQS